MLVFLTLCMGICREKYIYKGKHNLQKYGKDRLTEYNPNITCNSFTQNCSYIKHIFIL